VKQQHLFTCETTALIYLWNNSTYLLVKQQHLFTCETTALIYFWNNSTY